MGGVLAERHLLEAGELHPDLRAERLLDDEAVCGNETVVDCLNRTKPVLGYAIRSPEVVGNDPSGLGLFVSRGGRLPAHWTTNWGKRMRVTCAPLTFCSTRAAIS